MRLRLDTAQPRERFLLCEGRARESEKGKEEAKEERRTRMREWLPTATIRRHLPDGFKTPFHLSFGTGVETCFHTPWQTEKDEALISTGEG